MNMCTIHPTIQRKEVYSAGAIFGSLVLIRGLPGSGKSTLAKALIKAALEDPDNKDLDEEYRVITHLEADMFFIGEDGEYQYDPSKIKDAHAWCQRECAKALGQGHAVIVANTFTQKWELENYFNMATAAGIPVLIFECDGDFENIHGVPQDAIAAMRQRWEHVEVGLYDAPPY